MWERGDPRAAAHRLRPRRSGRARRLQARALAALQAVRRGRAGRRRGARPRAGRLDGGGGPGPREPADDEGAWSPSAAATRRRAGALIGEAARLASAHHDDLGAARAHHFCRWRTSCCCPCPRSSTGMARAAELVARHGLRSLQAFYLSTRGFVHAEAGEWDARAPARSMRAGALLEPGRPGRPHRFWLDEGHAALLLGSGELEAAEPRLLALLDRAFRRESARIEEIVREGWRRRDCSPATRPAARRAAAPGARPLRRADRDGAGRGRDCPDEGGRAGGRRRPRAGRRARELGRRGAPGAPRGPLLRGAARAPRDPRRAATALEDAVCGHRVGGLAGGRRARTRVVGADHRRRRPGGREPAVTLLRTAHARFRELGSEAWCRLIEERLRAHGRARAQPPQRDRARRPDRPRAGGAGAGGRGPHQPRDRRGPVLSQNTVIRHVANIFAKLGGQQPGRPAVAVAPRERGASMAKRWQGLVMNRRPGRA